MKHIITFKCSVIMNFKKDQESIVFVDYKTDMEITPSGIYTLVIPNLSLIKLPREGGAEMVSHFTFPALPI